MVVDFSRIDASECPTLILKNIAETPIGVLGNASSITPDIKYNEVSTLNFNISAYDDGEPVPYYDVVTGMKIVDLKGIGQFILMNPKEVGDGVKRVKQCKGYSLEYEFTFKKITMSNGTYNFWNPVAPEGTILGIILELMPSWGIGTVDSSLVGKYRTYEVSNENLYNFMKNKLQQSYNCIFDFDTYHRLINVRDVSSTVPTNPVYISLHNLAKEITIEEDTESIITRLDVNGADGVDIRDVNPTGDNKIINLDYYMTVDNFDQSTINKYYNWKALYKSYQLPYYITSIEYSLQITKKVTESAALAELEGELTSLENQQAVAISAIDIGVDTQTSLSEINAQIAAKKAEISAKKSEIAAIEAEAKSIMDQMIAINQTTNFKNYFTEYEYLAIDRFIRDDSISESSFVVQATESYRTGDYGNRVTSQTVVVSNSTVTQTTTSENRVIYDCKGGTIAMGGRLSATLIRCVFEVSPSGVFTMSAYLSKGSIDSSTFDTACLSLSGSYSSQSSSESALVVNLPEAYLYLTLNTSEYAKRAVAWDLFEYGNGILEKISQPSFKFSVTSADFLFLEDFKEFKNSLKHGEKLYVELPDGKVLAPISIGAKFEYDNPQNLSLEFSDTYVSGESSFLLADLLDQSISMGKKVDISKFTYSSFVDSGAHTQVKDFMNSALDVAKNAIMSSKDQAISWDDAGIRLRKWADDSHTTYDPRQVWMNNNSILMTGDNWTTASVAIGNFHDRNLGDIWGIVAPNIVGTLIAGSNLIIESAKEDGGVSVFKVDAEGCTLHNSAISVTSDATNTHILLDTEHGFAIGKYPLIDESGKINSNNYKFWADGLGNIYFRGTLSGVDGDFSGRVTATSGYIGGTNGWTIAGTYIYNGKPSYWSNDNGIYIGTDGIALGSSTRYVKMSRDGQLYANDGYFSGTINSESGKIGSWSMDAHGLYHGDVPDWSSSSDPNTVLKGMTSSAYLGEHGLSWYGKTLIYKDGVLMATSPSFNQASIVGCELGGLTSSDSQYSNFWVKLKARMRCSSDAVIDFESGSTQISNSSITTGTLHASNLSVSSFNPSSISTDTVSASSISASYIYSAGITSDYYYGRYGYPDIKLVGSEAWFGPSGEESISGQITYLRGRTVRLYAHSGGTVYLGYTSSTVVTSDERVKQISYMDNRYEDFFMNLSPLLYKYASVGHRNHIGFSAQQVESALSSAEIDTNDFAGLVIMKDIDLLKDETGEDEDRHYDELYGLRYEEFIALNTMMLQKAIKRIQSLEEKISDLESNNNQV